MADVLLPLVRFAEGQQMAIGHGGGTDAPISDVSISIATFSRGFSGIS